MPFTLGCGHGGSGQWWEERKKGSAYATQADEGSDGSCIPREPVLEANVMMASLLSPLLASQLIPSPHIPELSP